MENILKKIEKISSFASRYIGIIIIAFSCLAFFWRDGFAWMTNYTSVFLGVIMFGMGLTIRLEDFRAIFSRPKEVIIGAVAQYTIMPVVAWVLCKVMNLPADLALGVILVGCCPGGTASNVITYIAGGDVALSVGMTIVSTRTASHKNHTQSQICGKIHNFTQYPGYDWHDRILCNCANDHFLWSGKNCPEVFQTYGQSHANHDHTQKNRRIIFHPCKSIPPEKGKA